ncbi:hypothetical protein [Micromonospora coxensis]|uniref:Uncharacterized protein n=1 Tax=Micromonospora coxensis TaxID=356852 RepID=A0A1C5HYJ6_9ACTN|nr:hypothetical protein [Micromonospora coxensis]SCG51090.1 hypothetical protein GA0070614_1967 [Micromonospora coxensis]
MADVERRRRRLRHQPDAATGEGDGPSAVTAEVHDQTPAPRARRGPTGDEGERGLRGLVGSGSSQVGVRAAMRARDAARPSEEDLAEAEARLVIIRRNWVPREELPRSGR